MPKRPPRIDAPLSAPADLQDLDPGEDQPPSLAFETERGRLYCADALAFLGELAAESVDLVIADPPYAIEKAEWDEFESLEAYVAWCDRWLGEVERVLAPTGSAYICGFSEVLADVKARSSRRFAGGCRWLIWHYRNKANLGGDWGRSHESLLHLRKSKKTRINIDDVRIPYKGHTKRYPERVQAVSSQYGQGKRRDRWAPHPLGAKPRDVLEIPVLCNGMPEKTAHPTQKPEELMRRLIAASSPPEGLVVDPFAGSGTTAVVAERLDRRWLGADRDAAYVGLARERLGGEETSAAKPSRAPSPRAE